MSSRLTCITCQVGFTDPDLHREHFKGDWHRYNLKRKVANLATVTVEEFEKRKEAHETQAKIDKGEVRENGSYCIACRKNFSSKKAYENHLNSKRHKELVLQFGEAEHAAATKLKTPAETKTVVEEEQEDEEMEEVDSDEWDEEYEDDPVPTTDCLFCSHHSANLDNNIRHMTEVHSFFIPDPEFLVNIEGLLEYLGAKVGQGHMCLWCSEKGKSFQSAGAVQQHMVDKGHCRLRHEGETLVEYADFYDYSTSYPEGEGEQEPDAEVNLTNLDDSGYQLVLPSGATIGHRSLLRYYRQSLNPTRSLVPVDRSASGRLVSTYRALGWTGTNRVEAVKKARDIKFMHNIQNKSWMRLGWKANKLQTHFVDRNGMC